MPEIYTSASEAKVDKENKKPNGLELFSSALSSYIVNPKGIRFETQLPSEKIIAFLRQHFIVNFQWILVVIILALLPPTLGPLIIEANLLPSNIPTSYFILLPMVWYVVLFGYAYANYLHWFFNIYIITNQRVVDIDWITLLHKSFSTTENKNIQDVTYKQFGIVSSIFNSGDIYIQTAGSEKNFEFSQVPMPNKCVGILNKCIKKEDKDHGKL